jgi:two-component system sensor histidine kinase CpxA
MFRRILLWFGGMLIFSLVAFVLTSYVMSSRSPGREPFMRRISMFQLRESIDAWENGGAPELKEYLAKLDAAFGATHRLTDANGRDLVTGDDLSESLRRAAEPRPSWRRGRPKHLLIKRASTDGKYNFLIENEFPAPDPWANIAVYGWIVLTIVLLCYGLAWTLANPIRRLRETVVRFGAGDLHSRTGSKRRDELGDLERSFDQMADRIETLLTAERRLLQDISHELRSPLARLRFALELARSSSEPRPSLNRVEKEVERLSVLVNELLQVTRAEGDPHSRNVSPIDLQEFLSALVEDCRIEAAARDCTIDLAIRDSIIWQGDPELLHRAVENVLRNAIHHAPEGSEIEVDLLANGQNVTIRVRDRGPGVPDGQLTEIFRPFYRVEEDRSRQNGGGVGLGLSIAERAVRVHHGEIRATNAQPGLLVELKLPR